MSKTELLNSLADQEDENELRRYYESLLKDYESCPKESVVQKHVQDLIEKIFINSSIQVVDVSSNSSVTAKHDPSKYAVLSSEECNKASGNKNEKPTPLFKYKKSVHGRENKGRLKLLEEYNKTYECSLTDLKAGAPDIVLAKDFVFENTAETESGFTPNDKAEYYASFEIKKLGKDLKSIENNKLEFSQVYCHRSKVGIVILTNGRQWNIYGPEDEVIRISLWKGNDLYPSQWAKLMDKLNKLRRYIDKKASVAP